MNSNDSNSINWINWIEESISIGRIHYYEYKHFRNKEEIGSGGYGRVYRANRKKSEQYFALKSFIREEFAIKELAHEVIVNKKITSHRRFNVTELNHDITICTLNCILYMNLLNINSYFIIF